MANCKIVGIQKMDFIGNDKTPVKGVKFHCIVKNRYVEGYKCADPFFSTANFEALEFKPTIGTECNAVFSRYGRIIDFEESNDG